METLHAKDLYTKFFTLDGVANVLNGISISVPEGKMVGVVGETGSGKTVMLMSILGIVRPPGTVTSGEVLFFGEDLRLKGTEEMNQILGRDISYITQNPRAALNPMIRVGDQIANVIRVHTNCSKDEASSQAVAMIELVGISDPKQRAKAYPHELSGGMAQRICIALALSCSPKLLLADDPTTGLDVTIQTQVLDEMAELIRKYNYSTLIVTRDVGVVAQYCDEVAVLYAGQVIEHTDTKTFFRGARHPYSVAFLSRARTISTERRKHVKGVPPDFRYLPEGCYYHPRCEEMTALCKKESPGLKEIGPGHFVRCHLADGM
jgi:peptide/nickel transport system ATP-binding protein